MTTTTDDDITISRREWEAVMDRLAALEARPAAAPGPAPSAPAPLMGRRRALLGLAGAAAAGVATSVATAGPVAAADLDNVRAGTTTSATSPTALSYLNLNRPYGFAVLDGTVPDPSLNPAVYGQAKGQSFNVAVQAHAFGSAMGVLAQSSATGVGALTTSPTAAAVAAQNNGAGPAVTANSSGNQLVLTGGGGAAPNLRATGHSTGAICRTFPGDVWYCTGTTASSWRKLAGPATAGAFHVLPAPARAHDSRVSGGQLAANGTRTIDLKPAGVPAGARAALVTLLLVNATAGAGNATVWAAGVAKPSGNTMVWGGNAGRFTATAVSACDAQSRVQVHASLATHLVLDVVGYYL